MTGLLTSDQQFINRVTEIILENLHNENFGVREFADLSGMSRSALNHRLHSILHKNINEFVREVRLNKALEMLKNEDITASEVAFKVGFKSPAYFTKCFHEYFGYPPGHLEKKEPIIPEASMAKTLPSKLIQKISARIPTVLRIHGILFITALVIFILILVISGIYKNSKPDELRSGDSRISVAVMPFNNMTNEVTWNIWQVGIQDNLITYLSKNPDEFRVIQIKSINSLIELKGINNYSSISPKIAASISKKLEANILISGSISLSDNTIRINTHITNSNTGDILKSFQTDGNSEKILPLIDSLSVQIRNFLLNKFVN
jgi:AraC-like DNA-binding protein/TolB-like protein